MCVREFKIFVFEISFDLIFFFFWWDGFELGLHTCKAGALLLEPHLQPILPGYFGDGIF
jgi:hypothetical protein